MAITAESLLTRGFSNGEPLVQTHSERLNSYMGAAKKQYESLRDDLVGFTNQQNQSLRAFTQQNKDDVIGAVKAFNIPGVTTSMGTGEGSSFDTDDTRLEALKGGYDKYQYGADDGEYSNRHTPKGLAEPDRLTKDDPGSWTPDTVGATTAPVLGPTGDSNLDRLKAAIQGGATLMQRG